LHLRGFFFAIKSRKYWFDPNLTPTGATLALKIILQSSCVYVIIEKEAAKGGQHSDINKKPQFQVEGNILYVGTCARIVYSSYAYRLFRSQATFR
jgi:hypothetical protein